MGRRPNFRAYAEDYVAMLLESQATCEAIASDLAELADHFEGLGLTRRATVALAAAREHRDRLIRHRAQADAAQVRLERLRNGTG